MYFIYKKNRKRKNLFSIVLEKISIFVFEIYNKFVKFLKDLANISTTLIFFSKI
jgi:hypothetical protein